MTRTMESFARVARWPYAGSPPKSTNSLIKSSMSARDPSGLPNGPTGSSRRRLLPIFSPNPDRSPLPEQQPAASAPDKVSGPGEADRVLGGTAHDHHVLGVLQIVVVIAPEPVMAGDSPARVFGCWRPGLACRTATAEARTTGVRHREPNDRELTRPPAGRRLPMPASRRSPPNSARQARDLVSGSRDAIATRRSPATVPRAFPEAHPRAPGPFGAAALGGPGFSRLYGPAGAAGAWLCHRLEQRDHLGLAAQPVLPGHQPEGLPCPVYRLDRVGRWLGALDGLGGQLPPAPVNAAGLRPGPELCHPPGGHRGAGAGVDAELADPQRRDALGNQVAAGGIH